MKIRIYNACVLSMNRGEDIYKGEVHVCDGLITFCGSSDRVNDSQLQFDREIDAKGNLLMPGFKNAHTHSPMTFLRSFADDMPLQRWLTEQIFPMEAKLDDESVYYFTRLAILEYLTSGITSCFDMYCWQEAMAEAAIDSGFRYVICGTVNDFKDSVEIQEEMYKKFNSVHPLISYQMGIHAEYTSSYELMKRVAESAVRNKAPVYMHNSETVAEVKACQERYKTTPTVLFEDLGMFEYGGGGFHCNYMTAEDINIFKKHGLFAVTNPASNLKLASGIAPVSEMMSEGIKVAIGTDGPASNNCLDMFREMFLVTGLQKYRTENAAACPAYDVIEMAAVTSARAMCLENNETISEGSKADIIMLDLSQPNMQPEGNEIRNIVYSGSKQNVKMTMVNGQILYMDGEFFVGEDVNNIYKNVNKLFSKIKNI